MIFRPAIRPSHIFLRNSTAFRQLRPRFAGTMSAAETDTQAAETANTSGITTESLTKVLKEKLSAEHVQIDDMSGASLCSAVKDNN